MNKCKFLLGLLFIMCYAEGSGQTLMTLRCYFDDDTNPMQTISLGGQMSVDAPFTVDVSGLSQGVHTLYIEVLNFDGKWSHYCSKQVQVHGSLQMATLNLIEYYFDEEGPNGSGVTVAVDANTIDQTFEVSVDGLSNGPHVLFVRVRDAGGAWSIPTYRVIEVSGATYEEITEAEYFWNNDPGFGNGTTLPLEAFVIDEVFELSADGLNNGVHLLYIRVKDAKGQWSHAKEHVVQVGSQGNELANIVVGEYFIDVDPGEGLGSPIAMGPAYLIDDQFDLTMPNDLTAGSHWLYVRVMNEQGYWSQVVGRQINVCSISIPNVSITGATCEGGTATLTAPLGYNSYSWSTSQTGNIINVTQAGTYYLTVTDSDCSTTVPVEVSFANSQPPQLTIAGSACPGGLQTIAVEGNYSTYAWTGGSNASTLSVSAPGTYSVTVNAGTCPSTASVDVAYTTVPAIQTNLTGPNCTGATQTISITNDVYQSYQWLGGPALSSYAVTSTGEYTIQAIFAGCTTSQTIAVDFVDLATPPIAITGNPCQDQTLQLSVPNVYSGYSWSNGSQVSNTLVASNGTYTVLVNDGPCTATSSVDVTFGNLIVEPLNVTGSGCPGSLFTIAGANGYDSYSWTPGGNTTSFLNTTTPGEYTLTVTDGGCEGSVSTTVAYLDIPELLVQTSGDLCPDGLITLDAGPMYDSYLWTPGNATTSFLNITQSGVYTVEVNYEGCEISESTTITFIELPVPTIGQTQNVLTCNEGGYTYQWYLNGNPIADATNQFLNASVSGNYTVDIMGDGCTEGSANYFFQYIGVETRLEEKIQMYPNPTTDVLNIQGLPSTYKMYHLYDFTGRQVMEGRPGQTIELSSLSNGVYTIRFVGEEGMVTRRIEKIK